jgi:putative ABC transport system permease protein
LGQKKGFDTAHVIVAETDLPHDQYARSESRVAFDDAILNALRAIPGVRSAAMVSAMPLEGSAWIEEIIRTDRPRQQNPILNLRWVSPG